MNNEGYNPITQSVSDIESPPKKGLSGSDKDFGEGESPTLMIDSPDK